jgi:DNA-directed RNA polymerase subunit RPC12/RpoP
MADSKETGSPVSSLEKAPKTDEDLVAFAEDVWHYVKDSRTSLDYRIKEAIHFLAGDQWIRYQPHSQNFTGHALDEWIPTPVTNYLVKHFDRIVDLFVSGDLKPIVDPATKDQDDIEASRAAQSVLHSEFNRLKTETELYIPAAGWLVLAGTAVVSATWNARGGGTIKVPQYSMKKNEVTKNVYQCVACGYVDEAGIANQMQCPECGSQMQSKKTYALDDYGQPVYEKKREQKKDKDGKPVFSEFNAGQVVERVCNLLNWFPHPVRDWNECRYVVETDPMDIDQIKAIFGKAADDVGAEDLEVTEWSGLYDGAMQSHSGIDKSGTRDHALVKFLRHIPDKRWPKGLLLITAGSTVLYKGDLDSCDGKLPYTHISYRKLPGMFWGASPFQDLVPLQKRINAIDSHIVQNRKQMVSNQWLIPEGSAISHIDGRAGLMIRWSPHSTAGFKPERLPGVGVSQQVLNERVSTLQDMDEVSGAREILQGDVPPGPETGAAIEYLQEQAFRRFGPAVSNWREGLAEHEHRKLKLIEKYWDEPRLVRTLGHNRQTESDYFDKSDVEGATDMNVRVGIGMDFSQTSKRQRIEKALQEGLLGDPRDPNIRGKVLEKVGIEGFESDYLLDAKKARRALMALQRGEKPPPILPIDNHSIQFQIFREFMLTSEFEDLDEAMRTEIVARSEEHQQAMQQAQQQTMQAAEATKGAGPEAAEAVAQSGALGGEAPVQAVQ